MIYNKKIRKKFKKNKNKLEKKDEQNEQNEQKNGQKRFLYKTKTKHNKCSLKIQLLKEKILRYDKMN